MGRFSDIHADITERVESALSITELELLRGYLRSKGWETAEFAARIAERIACFPEVAA